MKIGTILFVYHRSEHTRKVLDALEKNDVLPQKLYIFQDGKKESTNIIEWNKVNELIQNITWCNTELHISKQNMGLAKSVVHGVNYVFQECEAVIVLEDDCVPHRNFMNFMVSALETYQKEKKVYSVSGYAWDVNLKQGENDAYFNGRICSYGWGTWKNRWCEYEEDYRMVTKMKKDSEINMRLQIWGRDLEEMIAGNVLGKCDSWAAFWALKVIERGGYCLSPYRQLIYNVGFDGSGVHNSKLRETNVELENNILESFHFPQKIGSTKTCEEEFQFLFAGKNTEEKMKAYQDLLIQWLQIKQNGKAIQIPSEWGDKIAVWGRGKIYDCLLGELEKQVSVKYIIESRPSLKSYNGIPIISISDLPDEIKNIVVVPYFDLEIIKLKVKNLGLDIRLWGIDELLNETICNM